MGDTQDVLAQSALIAIEQVCKRDNIPEHIRTKMRIIVNTEYEPNQRSFLVRVAWRDPEGSALQRGCTYRFNEMLINQNKMDVAGELVNMIDSINLRGELFFIKLHKHFPNRIDKVLCDRSGRVNVVFKNGRELSTSEQDLDSVEFLAACGMVYDL